MEAIGERERERETFSFSSGEFAKKTVGEILCCARGWKEGVGRVEGR